jgi:hypothetical protein
VNITLDDIDRLTGGRTGMFDVMCESPRNWMRYPVADVWGRGGDWPQVVNPDSVSS